MDIHFLSSEASISFSKITSFLAALIGKLYPDAKSLSLPSWIHKNEMTWLFEKDGELILASYWGGAVRMREILDLVQMKTKWEEFLKTIDSTNKVRLVIFGEKIPVSAVKFFAPEKSVRIFEIFEIPAEDKLFVREFNSRNNPEKRPQGEVILEKVNFPREMTESFSRQDSALSSFFYKMGKLSEEELTRFLELEQDLDERL